MKLLRFLMITSFAVVFVCVSAVNAQSDGLSDDQLAEQLEKASAVCLVEVTDVDDRDARPVDGNWTTTLQLKIIESTGKPPKQVRIIRAYGGRRRRPAPPQVVAAELLAKGKQLWLIFDNDQIVACWEKGDKKLPKSVINAVQKEDGKEQVDIEKLLKSAKAVCLVEITEIKEKDGRPYDGNFTVQVSFKVIEGKGKAPSMLHMIKAYGGRRAGPPPALPTVLKPEALKKGQRHYFVFSDKYDSTKYPAGVAAWWPAKSKSLPKQIVEAAKAGKK